MATKNQDWLIGPFVKQLLACVHRLPVVRPEKVLSSVLLVRGEFDGIAAVPDLEELFNRLPNGDRKCVILPGTAHSMSLAINRSCSGCRGGLSHHASDRDLSRKGARVIVESAAPPTPRVVRSNFGVVFIRRRHHEID
jgi:hypothetical protein